MILVPKARRSQRQNPGSNIFIGYTHAVVVVTTACIRPDDHLRVLRYNLDHRQQLMTLTYVATQVCTLMTSGRMGIPGAHERGARDWSAWVHGYT